MQNIKKLFSSPKQAVLVLACAGVMLAAMVVCIAVYAAGGPQGNAAIGGERAQSFAYADAGVDPVDAREVSVKYERFQDGFVYDVEFTAGDTEYEYKIDAEDGSVVKKERKTVAAPQASAPAALTMEEARAIALADAGVDDTQAFFTESKMDTEGGLLVYEFEFHAGDTQYEYGINGHTGAVYSKGVVVYQGQAPAPAQSAPPVQTAGQPVPDAAPSIPPAPQPTQQPGAQQLISLDEAKSAALADAGVDGAQAYFTKAELDHDDGISVYELEFYTGTHEYEYDIHAYTGQVRSRSAQAFTAGGHHSAPQPGQDGGIGLDAAKAGALGHAGCTADQVVFTKTELDYEDGRAVYEIEFRMGQAEYEYTIDAATGAVLEYDRELD